MTTLPPADRLDLLATFVRIVEAGSLSAAAAQLGTTQPTVSRRLQALERSLGVKLIARSTHGLRLSEDGERCLERARGLLADWQEFEADLRGAGEAAAGALRVVVPHAFGQEQLVGPLVEYLRTYPGVDVEWLLHDRRPDFVAAGVDCAIQVGELADDGVVAVRLSEVPRGVVVAPSLLPAPGRPLVPADLAPLPWLAMQPYYRTQVELRHATTGEVARIDLRPRLVTDNLFALRNAAVQGAGVAVASAWIVEPALAAGTLVDPLPDWRAAPLPVWLVYPHARFYPARLRRFVEAMRRALPEVPGMRAVTAGAGPAVTG